MKYQVQNKSGTPIVKNLSRRTAIKEQCLNCSSWSTTERTRCQHTDCQLHPYREGKTFEGWSSQERAKAIRVYCLDNCCCGSEADVTKCPTPTCPLFPFRRSKVDRSVEIPAGAQAGLVPASQATAPC